MKTDSKNKALLVLGIVLLAVGVYTLLPTIGIKLPTSVMAVTPTGTYGMEVETKEVQGLPNPFAIQVAAGRTYTWNMTVKNTGTIAWDGFWFTMRLAIPGSTAVDKQESGLIGTSTVEQCSAGTDTPDCRVDLTQWSLQYARSIDPVTKNLVNPISPSCGNKICAFTMTSSDIPSPGSEKSFYFSLKVPDTAPTGNYLLITNLGVNHATKTIMQKASVETVTVGTLKGEIVITLTALVASIVGLAALLRGAGYI